MASQRKIIELVGGNFLNKGAELMVDVCCEQIREWQLPWEVAMPWSSGSYQQRARRGLNHVVKVTSLGPFGNQIAKILPGGARRRLGVVSPSEVDAVFDISGFAYSDQWGPNLGKVMSSRAMKRGRLGERYFLLPQAFGPFIQADVRSAVKAYFDQAELIFVRDRISLSHVHGLMGDNDERIHLCPDFTCLADKTEPVSLKWKTPYACIVPNCRMVDPRHGDKAGAYQAYLLQAAKEIHKLGWNVVLMNHEGREDMNLVDQLAEKISTEVTMISGGSARELKAILGGARAVVASRFHAIISSLTQGVPVIGTGWSHKYEELFDDFDLPELLWTVERDPLELSDIFERLGRDAGYQDLREKVLKGAQNYRENALRLWSTLQTAIQCSK